MTIWSGSWSHCCTWEPRRVAQGNGGLDAATIGEPMQTNAPLQSCRRVQHKHPHRRAEVVSNQTQP